MDQRTRRSPARFLAPLALIAVIVAFLAILNDSGSNGTTTGDTSAATTTTTTAAKKTAKKAVAKKKAASKAAGTKTYTVQIGDTLQGIANKTGVTLERIQELNPNVDPRSMTAGQQIKLR